MTFDEWNSFLTFRKEFYEKVMEWKRFSDELLPLQKTAAMSDTPFYNVENPLVYNTALDSVLPEDEIKLIVIGDNPGKNEQLNKNRKYLVGQSGKLAEGFFRRNEELGVDFRKNAIILNKTPVHTAKTGHLKYLLKTGSEEIGQLIEESQIWFAKKTAELHKSLKNCRLWLVGYAELKPGGIFRSYGEELKKSYKENPSWNNVYVFQHFSMNCFNRDLNAYRANNPSLSLEKSLELLGIFHRKEIFGS